MASNPYVNQVKFGNQTIIDLTPTTAQESDVAEGKYFFKASGELVIGTNSGGGEVPVWQGSDDYVYLSDTVNAPAEIYVDDSGYVVLDMPPAVLNLQTKTRTYTPTTSQQTDTITADSGYDGLEEVDITVNAMPSAGTIGYFDDSSNGMTITVSSDGRVQANYIHKQYENAIDASDSPTGGGFIEVANGKVVNSFINIDTVKTEQLSTQGATAITPTESQQTAVSAGKYTTGAVTVNAIPSNYVGSGITRRSSSDLTVSGARITAPSGYYENNASEVVPNATLTGVSILNTGASISTGSNTLILSKSNASYTVQSSGGYVLASEQTVTSNVQLRADCTINPSLTVSGPTITAPSGYYSSSASESVASGSAGTPTATKGTVSNHSISVTPSVTNTTGYITGGTKTGTAVTVSASELVSGSQTISQNGTVNVTNLASVTVSVPSGYDIPIFSSNDGWTTVVCNKTYAQCIALLNEDGNGLAYANMGTSQAPNLVPLAGRINISDDDAIEYTFFDGTDSFDLIYRDNGTIVGNPSSLRMETLNVTENGTYVPPYPNFYGQVNVNVPSSARTCTITNSGDANSLYVRYNNTNYYTANNTFTFSGGGTLYITCSYGNSNGITLNGDNVVSTTQNPVISYAFTLPDCDIEISFTKSIGTSYVAITAPYLNITSNGNYDVGSYGYAKVNISGGGLVYESGTWTPSADTADYTISFTNTHTTAPFFYVINDSEGDYYTEANSNMQVRFVCSSLLGVDLYITATNVQYATVVSQYRGTSTTNFSTNSSVINTSSTAVISDYATSTGIRAYTNATSRYWRAGRAYKWIAVWAPTT